MAPYFCGAIFVCSFVRAPDSFCRSRKSLRHLRPLQLSSLDRWHTQYEECTSALVVNEKRVPWGGQMTDMVHATATASARVSDTYRWTQLAIGVAAMVMIANYQYGWTFFVPDIQKTFGWDRASIQWAFTLFVLFETWLVPIEGWFVDKYGPRLVVLIGGILCAIGWLINAEATTLNGYYLGMIVAGIGAGAVYGTCVGNALKWFPDKRGLAAGITAAGFGAGSALTVAPIQAMIRDSGFQTTFLYFGLGQGIIIMILAFFLFAPKPGQVPAAVQNNNIIQSRRDYKPTEVMRHPIFWLMYFMF